MIQKLCFFQTQRNFPYSSAYIPRPDRVSSIALHEAKEIHLFIIITREWATIAVQIQRQVASSAHGQCNKSEDNGWDREEGSDSLW